jgi:hypothetical protein
MLGKRLPCTSLFDVVKYDPCQSNEDACCVEHVDACLHFSISFDVLSPSKIDIEALTPLSVLVDRPPSMSLSLVCMKLFDPLVLTLKRGFREAAVLSLDEWKLSVVARCWWTQVTNMTW